MFLFSPPSPLLLYIDTMYIFNIKKNISIQMFMILFLFFSLLMRKIDLNIQRELFSHILDKLL